MRSFWLLGLLGASISVSAHPRTSKTYQSYKTGVQKRSTNIEDYRIGTGAVYTNGNEAVAQGLYRRTSSNYVDAATQLVKTTVPGAEFRQVQDHYVSANGIAHVYFKQTIHGIDVDNADFNVNVNPDGSIFSFGHSFFTGSTPDVNPLTKRSFVDPSAALSTVAKILNLPITGDASASGLDGVERYLLSGVTGAQSDPEARLVYLVKGDKPALTWRVETDVLDNWLLSYVDAVTNEEILGVIDYVSEAGSSASYEVL